MSSGAAEILGCEGTCADRGPSAAPRHVTEVDVRLKGSDHFPQNSLSQLHFSLTWLPPFHTPCTCLPSNPPDAETHGAGEAWPSDTPTPPVQVNPMKHDRGGPVLEQLASLLTQGSHGAHLPSHGLSSPRKLCSCDLRLLSDLSSHI